MARWVEGELASGGMDMVVLRGPVCSLEPCDVRAVMSMCDGAHSGCSGNSC